jgi:hypothetical protein
MTYQEFIQSAGPSAYLIFGFMVANLLLAISCLIARGLRKRPARSK